MQSIISKLNMLKTVHPSENWVIETRNKVLSKAPVFIVKELEYNSEHIYARKSIFNLNNLFANKLAVAFSALVFVLLGGSSVIYASKSSLPGEPLYAVKIANESMILAVASEGDKSKIEIQQVGNRLEELAKVSQNISDSNQEEKIVKLYEEIDTKSKRVDERLTKPNNNVQIAEKVSIAKVANNQYEKYGEALAKITKEMPDSMKEKVSPKANSALASTEKVNFSSLMVIVENNVSENITPTSSDNNEIKGKLMKIIEKEKGITTTKEENKSIANDASIIIKEEKTEIISKNIEINAISREGLLSSATKSLENGDLAGAAKNIAAAKEIGESEKVNDLNKVDNSIMPVPVFEDSGEVKGVVDEKEVGN